MDFPDEAAIVRPALRDPSEPDHGKPFTLGTRLKGLISPRIRASYRLDRAIFAPNSAGDAPRRRASAPLYPKFRS